MSLNIKVSFKNQTIELSNCKENCTVHELKAQLAKSTGVPVEGQKLLHKGRILSNEKRLADLNLANNAKLMLMGSQLQQIEQVMQQDQKIVTQQRLSASKPKVSARKSQKTAEDYKYTFHKISVIEEFPRPEEARKLLERLRDDRGIRAIMKQRKWSVGELTELTPFERSILGYNRNAGELISIRLRTDDLSGFRHYDSIRKVLLHELTHNVWSEHDDNFHALNRQLNKDVIMLDWTAHGGHKLDAGGAFYDPGEAGDDTAPQYQGGTFRLGGSSSSNSQMPLTPELQRELRAKAAMARLTKQEEQELDEGCGSSH